MSELYHYGIKGMKWGVRRYQNPDGTYTKAGKRRAKKQYKEEQRKRNKELKSYRTSLSKRASEMSDSELEEHVRRLRKEKELKTLVRELNQPKIARGKEYMNSKAMKKKKTKAMGVLVAAGMVAVPILIMKIRVGNPVVAEAMGLDPHLFRSMAEGLYNTAYMNALKKFGL